MITERKGNTTVNMLTDAEYPHEDLCHHCRKQNSDPTMNCPRSQALREMNISHGIVSMVVQCPAYLE